MHHKLRDSRGLLVGLLSTECFCTVLPIRVYSLKCWLVCGDFCGLVCESRAVYATKYRSSEVGRLPVFFLVGSNFCESESLAHLADTPPLAVKVCRTSSNP